MRTYIAMQFDSNQRDLHYTTVKIKYKYYSHIFEECLYIYVYILYIFIFLYIKFIYKSIYVYYKCFDNRHIKRCWMCIHFRWYVNSEPLHLHYLSRTNNTAGTSSTNSRIVFNALLNFNKFICFKLHNLITYNVSSMQFYYKIVYVEFIEQFTHTNILRIGH